MAKDLNDYILLGDFNKATEYYRKVDFKTFSDYLTNLAFDNQSITSYTFMVGLLLEEENAQLHELAFSLLSQSLCHIEGAYFASIYHARKAVELTGYANVKYMENLLFLNIVPDKVISDEEAQEIAKKIILLEPENEAAREILDKI